MTDTDTAARIVLSFRKPADVDEDDWWVADSPWLQESLTEETYLTYLRRAHAGTVAVGEEWAEVVNCGCASPQQVLLRVERMEGGEEFGEGTAIEVVPGDEVADATAAE